MQRVAAPRRGGAWRAARGSKPSRCGGGHSKAVARARAKDASQQEAREEAPASPAPGGNGSASAASPAASRNGSLMDQAGVSMGPISLSFAESSSGLLSGAETDEELCEMVRREREQLKSINSLSTSEWRRKYEKDGYVDLWVEEEFNAGSRVKGGGAVERGDSYGQLTGEGASQGIVPTHTVIINNHRDQQVVEVEIPEDRYILWEAEDAGLDLPYACRMGCCTTCAVKVKEGSVWQPEALGISKELKQLGYALMCVGYPESDAVLETVEEDELYEKQFGKAFREMALDKNSIFVQRDDFALELAEMDE